MRRSRIPNIPRCSSAPNTRCCAAHRGRRVRTWRGPPSATGTTPFAGRSSAASGARAMTSLSTSPIVRATDPAAARRRTILADVRESLARTPRELSPKYFYDERGSQLFEEITRLPEYYLTRAEREILEARADDIVRTVGPCT